jgi:hypothetical protein
MANSARQPHHAQTGFNPSVNGFAFTNSWPSAPAVTIPTPFGTIGIGNAKNGLCGGMVFAAQDYWVAGQTPPSQRPAPGTPLYKYIVERLIDSWHVPSGVAQYYLWMTLPDADISVNLLGQTIVVQHGISWRTIEQNWPLVKASLDSGVPAALGVVTVASSNPADLGQNHQALACAYTQSGSKVSMQVYDPNSGQADDVYISFDTSAPQSATTFENNLNIDQPIRGFFFDPYSPQTPPG